MSASYTTSSSSSFTITHAREIASRVATDLNLCSLYYGKPSSDRIADYLEELAQLINGGYVAEYEFGFKKDDERVVCWRYTVGPTGNLESDSPGKVAAWVDVSGAKYYNFLTFNATWYALSQADKSKIENGLPFQRSEGELPSDGQGHWITDKSYSSGGIAASRQTFVPFL